MNLTTQLANKLLVINKVNSPNKLVLHKLNNIGIIKGNKIIVLDYHKSKTLIHLLVYGVEYVLRKADCAYIDVSEVNDGK